MAAALKATSSMLLAGGCPRRVVPFAPIRGASVLTRATGTPTPTPSTPPLVFTRVPSIEYTKDTETIKDVFAWQGPLAERLNGRLAMWAFLSIAISEATSHTPAAQQFGNDAGAVILLSLLLTSASLAPKFASGTSLKALHATATGDKMPDGFLANFDEAKELWTGRVAMLGITGLLIAEVFKGDAIF